MAHDGAGVAFFIQQGPDFLTQVWRRTLRRSVARQR
jgi:hypothetical protein